MNLVWVAEQSSATCWDIFQATDIPYEATSKVTAVRKTHTCSYGFSNEGAFTCTVFVFRPYDAEHKTQVLLYYSRHHNYVSSEATPRTRMLTFEKPVDDKVLGAIMSAHVQLLGDTGFQPEPPVLL